MLKFIGKITNESIVDVTGIDELSANNVQVYPNPTNGEFVTITGLKESDTNVKILNTLGALVLESVVNSNSASIDISKLSMGTYFIQLINSKSNSVVTKKIVVIK